MGILLVYYSFSSPIKGKGRERNGERGNLFQFVLFTVCSLFLLFFSLVILQIFFYIVLCTVVVCFSLCICYLPAPFYVMPSKKAGIHGQRSPGMGFGVRNESLK